MHADSAIADAAGAGAGDTGRPVQGEPTTENGTDTPQTCANCHTSLLGPHCHQCGQPVKGLVRHFSSVIGDLFDTLLALDSRIWRTLVPLLLRPGYLTREYLDGRRVRYVSPVRLFIFLCLTTFFVMRLTTDWGTGLDTDKLTGNFAGAETVEEVERIRREALDGLDSAIVEGEDENVPGVVTGGLEVAREEVNRQADRRLAQLGGEAADAAPPADAGSVDEDAAVSGEPHWTSVEAFSPGLNEWLSTRLQRVDKNARLIREDPNLFREALFGAIPSMLLVLLPLFSLMLWVLYVFRRRLYMEHLIVALHSHAFLCLALLLVELLSEAEDWLAPGLVRSALGWAGALLVAWMPLYLLLMQKRVYGQGWGMTLFKYSLLGLLYSLLVGLATSITALATLASL
ncbi:DUF3667 domain-containing protein [Microbulbifer sediminum]|uniref:DUF3667 domain-containing protein n=1 Tax=Microbulbifer sediminum TaxID=2904250 RepID=UPI001F22B7DB|nr:DUF3667 domain-containing protein [Microbulbifer sediminum]